MPPSTWDPNTAATGPAELLRLLQDQEGLLVAVAAGLRRNDELDREYWVRARTIDNGLAAYGLRQPLPYRDLGAWVAECRLRLPDPKQQRDALARFFGPARSALSDGPPAL